MPVVNVVDSNTVTITNIKVSHNHILVLMDNWEEPDFKHLRLMVRWRTGLNDGSDAVM